MSEQRYQAVLAVIAHGEAVTDVAVHWGVSRQTVHAWVRRYEDGGLDALADRSRRPRGSPHQMSAVIDAAVVSMRVAHPGWGPRRIRHELARQGVVDEEQLPSESGILRALHRAGLIDLGARRRRKESWKRWERAHPMELWQMDIVGGFPLKDGTSAKALTGVDDHSRFCVSAALMPKERTRAVCEALASAMRAHGVPQQILTDNGKVFTGRFHHPPVEVLFDRICRENGVEHLLTAPRSPTTTGKVERFHRSLRTEFLTGQIFTSLRTAQRALDEWVGHYNTDRPHQSLSMDTPAQRFFASPNAASADQQALADQASARPRPLDDAALVAQRTGDEWVSRRVASNGVVAVSWQQVSVGKHHAGARCDVKVTDGLLQFWIGADLVKAVARTSTGAIRKKRASNPRTPRDDD